MTLTTKECDLLYQMFNASILMSKNSGIPIGKEYYELIDSLREKILKEGVEARRKEYG